MITFILTFLTAHLGFIAGSLMGLAGLAFGGVRHLQAKAATATAGQAVAQASAQVANERASDATANQAAAQAGSTAATDRTAIDADIAAKSPTEVQSEIDQLRQ